MDGFAVRAADTPGRSASSAKSRPAGPSREALARGRGDRDLDRRRRPRGRRRGRPDRARRRRRRRRRGPRARRRRSATCASAAATSARGDDVLDGGRDLTPARLAALAACGIARGRRARGVRASRSPSPGPSCAARAKRSSRVRSTSRTGSCSRPPSPQPAHVVERLGVGGGLRGRARAALARALEADVLVTSGGVSVGPHDLVRRVLARARRRGGVLGCRDAAGQAARLRRARRTLVFGLPGNPVSSLVGALLFVRPALLALQGDPEPGAAVPARHARARACAARPERDDFVRARSRGDEAGPLSTRSPGQESHMIVQTAAADALVHVPRGDEPLPAGAGSASSRSSSAANAGPSHRGRAQPYRPAASAPELRRDGGPDDQDEHRRPRDEPERHQRDDVERGVEPEPELRPRSRRARAPDRRGRHRRGRRGPSPASLDLRQPEPGVQRGQHEEETVRADERRRDGDAAERERARRRSRRARSSASAARRTRATGGRATSRAPRGAENEQAGHRPVGDGRAVGRRRDRRPARERRRRARRARRGARPRARRRAASAAPASAGRGARRRRQRAKRSIEPTRNGTSATSRTSSIAQPRTIRSPR